MAFLSLRTAAQQAGTSKSTILWGIQSGRLSATRTEDGYQIDSAELSRVYPANLAILETEVRLLRELLAEDWLQQSRRPWWKRLTG
jgi:hypothetical protein